MITSFMWVCALAFLGIIISTGQCFSNDVLTLVSCTSHHTTPCKIYCCRVIEFFIAFVADNFTSFLEPHFLLRIASTQVYILIYFYLFINKLNLK